MIKIRSAIEMKKAVDKELAENDFLIMSAAVADYKPKKVSPKKIKKDSTFNKIDLESTTDILSSFKEKRSKNNRLCS